MQPQPIAHVRHLIRSIHRAALHPRGRDLLAAGQRASMLRGGVDGGGRGGALGAAVTALAGPSVERFAQAAFEDFHDAVGVGVVVDGGGFAGGPDEDELVR